LNWEWTPQMRQVRDFLHYFAQTEIRPISRAADIAHEVPLSFLTKVKALGISMEPIPASVGSAGGGEGVGEEEDSKRVRQTNRIAVVAAEEMAWGDAAVIITLPGPGLGGPPVAATGTAEQKTRLFGVFSAPEPKWGAYALTEPEAGSDASGVQMTAAQTSGGYILNGTKTFITNGARAEWIVTFATVDRSLGRRGQRAFVVEKGQPGLEPGRIFDKMGLRASETSEFTLVDAFVPDHNLLGGESYYQERQAKGFRVAMATFDSTRPLVAAMAVGIARAALEEATDRLTQNSALSLATPLAGATRARLGQMAVELEMARALVFEAASMADARQPNAKMASMSKAFAGQVAMAICRQAMDLVGSVGALGDSLLEKWYRDIKVFDIFEGTGQIQRIVISRRLFEEAGAAN